MVLPDFLLILGVLLGGVAVYVAMSNLLESILSNKNVALSWSSGDAPRKSKSPIIRLLRPLVHRLVIPILARYQLKEYKEKLKREINSAGLGQELNADEYIGLQVLMGLLFPSLIVIFNLLFALQYPWWFAPTLGAVGVAFPYSPVKGHKAIRRQQIIIDLPFVVDLLSLSTKAGMDFIGAIQKVVEKMNLGPLAEELGQVLRDLKLGSSRVEALNAMAWRLNMSEVTSFVAVLATADSLGASITDVLRQQSDQMRQERFLRAEKAGGEASQKIFIPIILFILPAVLIMVFGPIILQFMGGSK